MHRVFVYGTLKRGFPNHDAGLAGQRFLGRFHTRDAYPLVVAGRWFSPVLLAERGTGHRVHGEVFAVDDEVLAELDRIESTHLPQGYDRIGIAVTAAFGDAAFDAWTYVKQRERLDVIHSGPLEEYGQDPRYVPAAERDG